MILSPPSLTNLPTRYTYTVSPVIQAAILCLRICQSLESCLPLIHYSHENRISKMKNDL